jgi:hypothetical protein
VEIKADVITVVPATHDPDGHALEPELAPAVRSIQVTTPLQLSTGQVIRADMPGSFDYETTAGELALNMRFRCGACVHFNVKRWRDFRRECEWSGDAEKRQWVNEFRFAIEQAMPAGEREKHLDASGELDIEHAMDSMGLCDALTEEWSRLANDAWPVVMCALAGCPDTDPWGRKQAAPFRARDRAADRAAAAAYDALLGMARGKQPDSK